MFPGRHIQNSSPTVTSAVTPAHASKYAPRPDGVPHPGSGQPQVTYKSAATSTGNTIAAAHQRRVRTPLRHH